MHDPLTGVTINWEDFLEKTHNNLLPVSKKNEIIFELCVLENETFKRPASVLNDHTELNKTSNSTNHDIPELKAQCDRYKTQVPYRKRGFCIL